MMIYQNAGSDSDVESESNFQQTVGDKGRMSSNNNSFVRNNCGLRMTNNQQQVSSARNMLSATSGFQRRRASDCSSYNFGDGACNNINFNGPSLTAMKRGSQNGGVERRHSSQNNKSSLSTSSDDVSSGSHSSCSISDDTSSTSSGQPNLPYPGFVEFSFKYLSQDTRLRNWCLQLITNP
jgi:hypothetical protein